MLHEFRRRIRALAPKLFPWKIFLSGGKGVRLVSEARWEELQNTAAALRDALASAEQRREILEAMMEHIPMGITIADAPDGAIRAVSRYGCQIIGKSCKELTGISPVEQADRWQMLHADGITPARADEVPLYRATSHGEIVNGEEWAITRANGEKVHVLYTAAPIRDREGHIKGGVTGWQDLTQRKQAEGALIKTEKLAATGRLAATIAHEINNPLGAITNIVYLLEQLTTDAAGRQYIEMLNNQLRAVSRIATQTLKFHRESCEPTQFSLGEMLSELLEFYAHKAMTCGVTISKRLEADGRIVGYVGEIRQVMANLLLNAIEATPPAGKVVAHCYPSRSWHNGARGYRVSVADTGIGIERQNRSRIFEPFFTTKGEKGTGLGLWVSLGIVHHAGGVMHVWSTQHPGRSGTCFNVFLPEGQLRVMPRRRRYESTQLRSAA
jgi:PAS domain S-box-containing protein